MYPHVLSFYWLGAGCIDVWQIWCMLLPFSGHVQLFYLNSCMFTKARMQCGQFAMRWVFWWRSVGKLKCLMQSNYLLLSYISIWRYGFRSSLSTYHLFLLEVFQLIAASVAIKLLSKLLLCCLYLAKSWIKRFQGHSWSIWFCTIQIISVWIIALHIWSTVMSWVADVA